MKVLLLFLFLFILPLSAHAFEGWDGERNGFTAGLSIGTGFSFVPLIYYFEEEKHDYVGFPIIGDLYLGGITKGKQAFVSVRLSESLIFLLKEKYDKEEESILDSKGFAPLTGASLSFSFFTQPQAPSSVISAALGVAFLFNEPGVNLILSGGYEFYPHCIVEGGLRYQGIFPKKNFYEEDSKERIDFLSFFIAMTFLGY